MLLHMDNNFQTRESWETEENLSQTLCARVRMQLIPSAPFSSLQLPQALSASHFDCCFNPWYGSYESNQKDSKNHQLRAIVRAH